MVKFYAVARGREIGVYKNWQQAMQQLVGFSGNYSRSFESISEAERCILYMRSHPSVKSYNPTCKCSMCSKNEFPKDLLPIKHFFKQMENDQTAKNSSANSKIKKQKGLKRDYSKILRNKNSIVLEAEINSDDELVSLTPNGRKQFSHSKDRAKKRRISNDESKAEIVEPAKYDDFNHLLQDRTRLAAENEKLKIEIDDLKVKHEKISAKFDKKREKLSDELQGLYDQNEMEKSEIFRLKEENSKLKNDLAQKEREIQENAGQLEQSPVGALMPKLESGSDLSVCCKLLKCELMIAEKTIRTLRKEMEECDCF